MTAWIDQTIGATPADRAKQKNALFLVLSKMDREFEQKAGETEESRHLRWSARIGNSLVNNFRGEWPLNWNGRPFDNTFWLRNPTVIDERLMDYDGGREIGIADPSAQRATELRRYFIDNEDVRRHFADPARAWDEAFRANDGGVSYLVKSLIPVCDPAIKRAQVRGQLEVQIRRLVDRLAGFHSASDGDARTKKRDLVHTVLRGLANVIQQQLFGELVAALQVADTALREIYFRIATARASDETPTRNGKPQGPVAQSTGAAVDLGAIFADVFGEEAGHHAPTPSGVLEDRAERFAREAADYWLENMRRVGADEKALSHYGVDRQHLGWLIDELIVGAHRLKLIDQLSHEVRALENAANAKWEEIAERQVRTASSALNGYVSALGFDKLPIDQRPGLPPNAPTRRVFEHPTLMADGVPVLSEDPAPIYADYCKDWMRAFLQLAMDNVGYEGAARSRRSRTIASAPSCAPCRRKERPSRCLLRASITPLTEPGHALLRVSELDAAPDGLTISIQRQQGPDSHLADDGWRRTETWLMPDQVRRRGEVLEFHLGPEICDRLAGIATVRLRVREPDIGVVGTTVVAWPAMLTSGAADGSNPFADDIVRLRRARERPALEPAPCRSHQPSSCRHHRRHPGRYRSCVQRAIRWPISRSAAAARAGWSRQQSC